MDTSPAPAPPAPPAPPGAALRPVEPAPGTPGAPGTATAGTDAARSADRLGAEVRESVLLLLLSVAVTAGLAGAASGLLTLLS